MCLEAWDALGRGVVTSVPFSPLLLSNFSGQSWTESWWGGRVGGGVRWGCRVVTGESGYVFSE